MSWSQINQGFDPKQRPPKKTIGGDLVMMVMGGRGVGRTFGRGPEDASAVVWTRRGGKNHRKKLLNQTCEDSAALC